MNAATTSALQRMAAQKFPTDEAIESVHAAAFSPPTTTTPDRRIVRLPDDDRPTSRPRVRILVAAAVTVAVAIGTVTVLHLTGPATVQTAAPLHYTPLPATDTVAQVLGGLAPRAVSQPPLPGAGPYNYVHTKGWYFGTSQSTDGTILSSGTYPADSQRWRSADGSGRIDTTGSDAATRANGTYAPGKLSTGIVGSAGQSAAALVAELTAENADRDGSGWLQLTDELWSRQAVTPNLQSALLTILAARTDITLQGTVNDRLGRPGIAVGADDHHNTPALHHTAIFDPTTGTLLSYENVALEPGGLPITAPATIAYTLWLSSGYTQDTTSTIP